ncbi:drug/metabolite transporter (DMT)-like permease [Conyzicola lurida]|uniref:Drug/metabolite transporter (DMT)-like permease n=1 Tax=Conyzicola lurida TaxID=1172621 RepID=A0A841AJA6_9MICO|nr:DMT family transporter [Conyzicola lurida]MBB5842408.1 drug/metabolite transporter (DMT)-like permease [Conyzicola lurida]
MTTQTCLLRSGVTIAASAAFVLAWSSGFVAAKVATVDGSMWTLLLWRYLLLAGVLVAVSLSTGALRGLGRTAVRRQIAVGAFSQLGYVVFVYASVAVGISTGTTALIDAVQPLVVATLVGPLLGTRVRGASWAGLALGAVGVVLVVGSQISSAPPVAYALPALAMACLIAATFIDRRHPNDLPILATLTIHVMVVALALTAIAVVTGDATPPASSTFWATTAFAAAVPSLLAYGLYWWLIRRIGVTSLNALLFAVAPTTAVAGAIAFGEPFTWITAVGFGVSAVAVAVVLAAERPRRAQAAVLPSRAVPSPIHR